MKWEEIISNREVSRLVRWVARSPRRPSASQTRLLPEKGSAPLLVCLDMKDWISLSRVHYGKREPDASGAFEAIKAAVEARRIVVPITSINLLEVGQISDPAKRMRLARFMVRLSGNHSLVDHEQVNEAELGEALARVYLKRQVESVIRPRSLRWGTAWAGGIREMTKFGNAAQFEVLMREAMLHPFMSARSLGRLTSPEEIERGQEIDQQSKMWDEILRRETQDLSETERWKFESRHTLHEGPVALRLRRAVSRLSLDWQDVEQWLANDENRVSFMRSVPSLAVSFQLRVKRNRNPQHRTHENDLKDLLFLSSVIPYADVVVTEKSWGSVAKAAKIDSEYGTRICLNVNEGAAVIKALLAE